MIKIKKIKALAFILILSYIISFLINVDYYRDYIYIYSNNYSHRLLSVAHISKTGFSSALNHIDHKKLSLSPYENGLYYENLIHGFRLYPCRYISLKNSKLNNLINFKEEFFMSYFHGSSHK
ncbi:hypothetical protein CLPU_6c01140 [Gottschalkia purinilytica]|uniref:Uncharacterized protein n=1 Tax=Gottschalkia purinilytica TaxID=1503 RepID=A0A0L0WAV3_GOTPU|nr:hypothetical protein CLPU_6c01140 [Gottschalkia purinilytica]